jgi:hypothetical protein
VLQKALVQTAAFIDRNTIGSSAEAPIANLDTESLGHYYISTKGTLVCAASDSKFKTVQVEGLVKSELTRLS